MPYFRWKGIDLTGTPCAGRSCAASLDDLDAQLLKKDIALIQGTQVTRQMLDRPLTMDAKIQFFSSLSTLLESGVTIPDALELAAQQITNVPFHDALYTIKQQVETGITLADAMSKYRHIFNPLMIEMVHVGYETGDLPQSLNQLSSYLETMQDFRKKIRMALTMPLITFTFFMIIASVLVLWVVPQFESFFVSLKQPLPASTKAILSLNSFLRSYGLLVIGMITGLSVLCSWLYRVNIRVRYFFDRIALNLPFFGNLTVTRINAQVSHALALLLEGGITVIDALEIVIGLVDNVVVRDALMRVKKDVEAGVNISDALARHGEGYLGSDSIALIRVGEVSATLGPMFATAARRAQASVGYTLQWILNLLQPLVIIFLGILITGLILAIYLPIMTISWGI